MQISLDTAQGTYLIRAYQPESIQVNDTWITHSIIITPEKLIDPWKPQSIQELNSRDFEEIIELAPKIVLLGTGNRLCFPATELLAPLYERQIGVEIMDTGAACRTYNVLMSEGRSVIAALLIR